MISYAEASLTLQVLSILISSWFSASLHPLCWVKVGNAGKMQSIYENEICKDPDWARQNISIPCIPRSLSQPAPLKWLALVLLLFLPTVKIASTWGARPQIHTGAHSMSRPFCTVWDYEWEINHTPSQAAVTHTAKQIPYPPTPNPLSHMNEIFSQVTPSFLL